MGDPKALGRRGEQTAERYLTAHGMAVVQRNWRCREGEVDLILRDGRTLVFCEVKTRRGVGYGDPLEAITRRKTGRLRTLAAAYLQAAGGHDGPVRIDAVGIVWVSESRIILRHVIGVA